MRRACEQLARTALRGYTLSPEEHAEELERLTDLLESTLTVDLESLEHRRKT